MFFLKLEGIIDSDYSLYHYGPFSVEVAQELDYAQCEKLLEIQWKMDSGYFIKTNEEKSEELEKLDQHTKQTINDVIKRYGHYDASKISIIATALYIRDRFGINDQDLAEKVKSIKPKYSVDQIATLLLECGVVNN